MPPTQRGLPPDWRPLHKAFAATANTPPGEPLRFYGFCIAADFFSRHLRDTQDAAKADVDEHLRDVQARPHRAVANMLPDAPHGYIGFCDAGDFSPRTRRDTRDQALADVVKHLEAMGDRALLPGDPAAGGQLGAPDSGAP